MTDSSSSSQTGPRTPLLAADAIIEYPDGGIVLVARKSAPLGWALPGGFVELGESAEHAAVREVREETGLRVALIRQQGTYSDPARDPRGPVASVVFVARPLDAAPPRAGSDAARAQRFSLGEVPWEELAFDHAAILRDYLAGGGPTAGVVPSTSAPSLTEAEQAALLAGARATLAELLDGSSRGGVGTAAPASPPGLRAPRGVFATLTHRERALGVAGWLRPLLPLEEGARSAVLLAAAAALAGHPAADVAAARLRLDLVGARTPLGTAEAGAQDEDISTDHGIAVEVRGRTGVWLPSQSGDGLAVSPPQRMRVAARHAGVEVEPLDAPEVARWRFAVTTLREGR
jgi:8-oxo-dGTP diphosphatase